MRLVPLPSLEDNPRDEEAEGFEDALSNARLTDEAYLKVMRGIDASSEDALSSRATG